MTHRGCDSPSIHTNGHFTCGTLRIRDLPGQSHALIVSLFPGIDLLGTGFEQAGFCVVRGPDLIYGGDIRTFAPPAGMFDGVIGGPPCQDFSKSRRATPTGYGQEMIDEFARVVMHASPGWWLMENVPQVPDVRIPGYSWQRIDLRANEFGLAQSRLRHFQYGNRDNVPLIMARVATNEATEACCLATEGTRQDRRSWGDFCELQGLPRTFKLPGLSRAAAYRAVGNGVPVPMARALAEAIRDQVSGTPCACSCGRPVTGKAVYATAACRKRAQRRRDNDEVTSLSEVTRQKKGRSPAHDGQENGDEQLWRAF